jgi:hypothetical protein
MGTGFVSKVLVCNARGSENKPRFHLIDVVEAAQVQLRDPLPVGGPAGLVVANPHDARDATQEVLIRLITKGKVLRRARKSGPDSTSGEPQVRKLRWWRWSADRRRTADRDRRWPHRQGAGGSFQT